MPVESPRLAMVRALASSLAAAYAAGDVTAVRVALEAIATLTGGRDPNDEGRTIEALR